MALKEDGTTISSARLHTSQKLVVYFGETVLFVGYVLLIIPASNTAANKHQNTEEELYLSVCTSKTPVYFTGST